MSAKITWSIVLSIVLCCAIALNTRSAIAEEEPPPIDDESEEPTVIGSVRGIAFADLNANGVFDSATGEYPLGWAYFKLADEGNSYYQCGYVGPDGTFGVPVTEGDYILMPIGAPGWRVTTPYIEAARTDTVYRPNFMGFAPDAKAPLETCNQYGPTRVATKHAETAEE